MSTRREFAAFALVLGLLVAALLRESLFGGKILSAADVVFVSASFRDVAGPDYEPVNRLLTDPVLQFQPWLEFNRAMLRRGRIPVWNDRAGCGTPHLSNSQSAVFDPFHLIAYLGKLPEAIAWMAAARLWFAGLGTYLLARSWGFGTWGRWFAGLSYPFCGFLVVWLLYPVTAAAVWLPWLFWASDRVLDGSGPRRVGLLGLIVGGVFLAGHVQTSAHVLLAGGLYVLWRAIPGRFEGVGAWGMGVGLGLVIAAVSILPLAVYLGKSPVWADRGREKPSPFQLTRPRVLDAVCTAVPYAFGSQRRGQPNLARAVGVHNLNESAGGYAGLATLIWLAPTAWRSRKQGDRIAFLTALTAVGFLGAFGFPPVVNGLRAVPVLDVMDQRRLTLWVAFGLVLLGGAGLDRLAEVKPIGASLWGGLAALLCLGSFAAAQAGPMLRGRAEAHYATAARITEGADPAVYRHRADRQVRQAIEHLPRQVRLTAAELALLAALAALAGRGMISWSATKGILLALTVVELLAFGDALNPAIDPADDRPETRLIARLREIGGRLIGVGEEFPPNLAMRYGLADPRNYDSIELTRNLDWFEPLYEPGQTARTSRRTVTWAGVARARERLREAGVVAVVAATPPPKAFGAIAERIGSVWLARMDAEPIASTLAGDRPTSSRFDQDRIGISIVCGSKTTLIVRETFDPGWRADVDGRPAAIAPYRGTFLSVGLEAGSHRLRLVYDPWEVRAARSMTLVALSVAVFALTGFRPIRSTRFPGQGLGPFRAVGLESDL